MKVDESTIGQAHFGNAPGKFEHGPYWLKKAVSQCPLIMSTETNPPPPTHHPNWQGMLKTTLNFKPF